MKTKTQLMFLMAFVVVWFGLAPTTTAELRTVQFQGVVDRITGGNVLDGSVQVNGAFTGSYTFDTAKPSDSTYKGEVHYQFTSSDQRFIVSVGNYAWRSTDMWDCGVINNDTGLYNNVRDMFEEGSDYIIVEQTAGSPVPAYPPDNTFILQFGLGSTTNLSVLANTAVPQTLPDLGLCEINYLSIAGIGWEIHGRFTAQLSYPSLLTDSQYNDSVDSADLRADSEGQDWYESRNDDPLLVTLTSAGVGQNSTAKAAFAASETRNAYLTQEFCQPITQTATIEWDIYVASILNISAPDRAAWMLIGDDTGGNASLGPNAEDSERFVYLGFYKSGGGSSGTMDLVARDRDDSWASFTTVASNLNMKQWYTIKVSLNLVAGTYDVSVDGEPKATVTSRHPKSSVTHISFAQWSDGAGSFYVDNVRAEPLSCPSPLTDGQYDDSVDSLDLQADSPGQDWYESRREEPSLVSLNKANIGGNSTPKAAFAASNTRNVYLTQEFCQPITQTATIQWDIYVASILNSARYPDRAAWMLIGDDTGADPTRVGPNAEDSERFVYLGFYRNGGGTSGTMSLVARDRDDTWSTFTTVASSLNIGQWYTIKVSLNLAAGTYDVSVDGQPKATVTSRTPKNEVTHISFAQWQDGAGSFYVDNVKAESAPAGQTGEIVVVDESWKGGGITACELAIPDAGQWAQSWAVNNAPAEARVTRVSYWVELVDPFDVVGMLFDCSDYEIGISSTTRGGTGNYLLVWDNASDDTCLAISLADSTDAFNGQPVNQTWFFRAKDTVANGKYACLHRVKFVIEYAVAP